jgi:outer membrane protein assembly factor BamA
VRAYQSRGHFHAAVDTESNLEDGTWVTTFHVSPGAKYKLAGVTFAGNEKVPDKQLAEVVTTTSKGSFLQRLFGRAQGVTSGQLSDDRDALESYYRLKRILAGAGGHAVVVTNDAAGTMTVTFPVNEGPQTIVADVRIEGMTSSRKASFPTSRSRPESR